VSRDPEEITKSRVSVFSSLKPEAPDRNGIYCLVLATRTGIEPVGLQPGEFVAAAGFAERD
jgi:hypothetical protein